MVQMAYSLKLLPRAEIEARQGIMDGLPKLRLFLMVLGEFGELWTGLVGKELSLILVNILA